MTPPKTPETATSTLADSASVIVSRKRDGTFSSITTRGNAMMISDGIGTMKRLISPARMSTSTATTKTTIEPSPSATGNQRVLLSAREVLMRCLRTPLPLVGRGRGWGRRGCGLRSNHLWHDPHPRPPHKGGGEERTPPRPCFSRPQKRSWVLARFQLLLLVVAQPLGRFLAQVAPDLRDVAAERLARHDLRGARARQLDLDGALEPAGPVGHHQDAVGELHRF